MRMPTPVQALDCLVATMRDNNTSHPCYMASDSALTSVRCLWPTVLQSNQACRLSR